MAKRIFGKIQDGIANVSESVSSRVADKIKEKTDEIIERVEIRVVRLGERLLKRAMGMLLIAASVIFLALALFYLFREVLLFNNALSFLIIGVVLLLIGIYMRSERRTMNYGQN